VLLKDDLIDGLANQIVTARERVAAG
jgi:hypothetical protein